ncbi:MAG: alpha-E domain-containing protein, partial [Candidatus Omnitrophica bacterium]|nr:alpha-E domain-containing protein [Candidatus Omnitrophota bacterium]
MLQWSALLRSASAYEMYRKRYGKLETKNIITFLALDRNFPRSMHYCLIAAERSLHAITGNTISSFSTEAEKELGRLRSELDYTDIDDIMNPGLHEFLDDFQLKHNRASNVIFETFFAVKD